MIALEEIEAIAQNIFPKSTISIRRINLFTIRIDLQNEWFVDIFQSGKNETKFAIHAQLGMKKIFRLDCRPEQSYKELPTFPWHFHEGAEDHVIASPFPREKRAALKGFLRYIKSVAKK